MPNRVTHVASLRDIPLVRRLAEHGTVLDSELGCIREGGSGSSTLLSSILLPQRSQVTLVTRVDDQTVLGQFRVKSSEHLANIVYIAPALDDETRDTAWLHLLDAMAAEAGRRGMHALTAEVDEASRLFQTMRAAGFAVYARQEIWRREPGVLGTETTPAVLTDETDADAMDIQLLYCNIVPRLVQQIAVPPSDSVGLVYRQGDRIMGYVAISEGRGGIYIIPYLHPDILFTESAAVLAGAMTRCKHDKLPVYICVRRYQDWLEETLIDLGFETAAHQAVMVRHIAAGVRPKVFAPLKHKLEALPSPVRPPTTNIKVSEPGIDLSQQE